MAKRGEEFILALIGLAQGLFAERPLHEVPANLVLTRRVRGALSGQRSVSVVTPQRPLEQRHVAEHLERLRPIPQSPRRARQNAAPEDRTRAAAADCCGAGIALSADDTASSGTRMAPAPSFSSRSRAPRRSRQRRADDPERRDNASRACVASLPVGARNEQPASAAGVGDRSRRARWFRRGVEPSYTGHARQDAAEVAQRLAYVNPAAVEPELSDASARAGCRVSSSPRSPVAPRPCSRSSAEGRPHRPGKLASTGVFIWLPISPW